MRSLLVAAALAIATPALAQDAPAPSPATVAARVQKRVTANHYWTLEKMLRRFSREAGEARNRG